MIGTGALSRHLIKAHASVRNIKEVYIYGRNRKNAEAVANDLREEPFTVTVVDQIEQVIADVDIISCASCVV